MKSFQISVLFLISSLFLSAGFSGKSYAQGQMTGVRAMGMGEAFTANPAGSGALFHNPAGISSLMMYAVESSYAFDQQSGISYLHASVVDGKSNPALGGGVGYTYSVSSDNARVPGFQGHDLYGGIASPLIPGWVILGAALHYIDHYKLEEDIADGFTFDVGLLVSLGDLVSLGASVRDILDVEGTNRPISAAFGLNYHAWGSQLAIDVTVDFDDIETATSYNLGFETMITERVPVRFGYQYDAMMEQKLVSGGLGFRSDMLGVDALFRQSIDQSHVRVVGIAFDVYL